MKLTKGSAAAAVTPPGFTDASGSRTFSIAQELALACAASTAPTGPKPVVLAETWGSGSIRQVWYAAAGADVSRSSFVEDGGAIRIFLDDGETPAVDMAINDFFSYGARGGEYASEYVGRTSRISQQSSGYRNLYAPFGAYMRVEIENTTGEDVPAIYGSVDYTLDEVAAPPFATFRIIGSKDDQVAPFSHFTVADIDGAGQLESVYIAVDSTAEDEYGFLEGNVSICVDGESVPSIMSSGTEDFFGGGWYRIPIGGYPAGRAGDSDLTGSHVAMYRYFTHTPIAFNSHLTVIYPVGQQGQGTISPATLAVSADVGVWFQDSPAPKFTQPDTDNPIVVDPLTYPAGDLPADTFGQATDRVQATSTGTSVTFPYSTEESAQDMRVARLGLTLPESYWVETKMRITDNHDGMDAGLIASGATPDPYYGSATHVHLTRVSQFIWQVKARDDFDTPFVVNIADGSDLTDNWVWLAMKVDGASRSAYYRMDGATEWRPLGSWTTGLTGNAVGFYSWQCGCEFDQFDVYPLI